MDNKPTPHDQQSRKHLEEIENHIAVAEEKERLLGDIHALVESMGSSYLYELSSVQEGKIDLIRAMAEKTMQRCDEFNDLLRHGL